MSTTGCPAVVSSGITRPFGRLSLTGGHVSDTLLTRSPLGIATPYDLHVLATPPAFRLSQDQTLQLNFSARHPPHAPCDPCGLTGSDSFRRRGYPRNEFVHTGRVKTFTGRLLLPPPPARARGSVDVPPSCDETTPNCKAQTSLLAAPTREGRGLLKLIKEDHFACATRMSEIFVAPLDRLGTGPDRPRNDLDRPGHDSTPSRPSPHPRGFRLFTCQRTKLIRRLTS